jgi:hypothetical protein
MQTQRVEEEESDVDCYPYKKNAWITIIAVGMVMMTTDRCFLYSSVMTGRQAVLHPFPFLQRFVLKRILCPSVTEQIFATDVH